MESNDLWSGIFALVGVIVGGVLSWGIEWWRERRATRRSKILVAAICSAELRTFAENCEDVAYDDGSYLGQMAGRYDNGQEYRASQTSEPDLPTWSGDMRWDALDSQSLQMVFRLPIEYRRISRALGEIRGNDFPPFDDTFAERQFAYANMALHVLNIARRLENTEGLTPTDDKEIRVRLEAIRKRFPRCQVGRELEGGNRQEKAPTPALEART